MHFWSCDITKHEIYKIGHISAILNDRDFWFRPKNSVKSFAEHCTTLGVIKYISGHVTAHKLYLDRKVPISLKRLLLDIIVTIIHRYMHIIFSFGIMTFDLG